MKWIPILLIAGVLPAAPQWLNYHDARTPRTKDGKPNLTAPPPRVNGKPDLSGVWHVEPTSLAVMKQIFGADVDTLDVPGMEADTISKYAVNILLDFKSDDVPMRPQTAAMLGTGKGFVGGCAPIGIPLTYLVSEPDEIVQAPRQIVMMFESDGTHRQIHIDGRPLPHDPEPVEVTIDDPKMYTKPFSIKFTQELLADSDVLENICAENEKDVVHIGRN